MLLWSIIHSILLLSSAVDRNNFKKCDQSGFCKRLRGMEKDRSAYYMNPLTLTQLNSSSIGFDIRHETSQHVHTATIRILKDNTLRITAQEKDPVSPRYNPVDSLGDKPLVDDRCQLTKSEDSATVSFSANKILISYNPLRLDVFSSGSLVASINARGLFHVETQQIKPEVPDSVEQEEDDLGVPSEEEAAQMEWEESFRSHDDTNPRGPRAISLDVSFTGFDKVYGLPEHADTFPLKSTEGTDPYRLYNLDVFEYELNNPMALYGSIPYLYALSPQQSVGMMWLNAAETWVDINFSSDKSLVGRVLSSFLSSEEEISKVDTHWMSESGIMDIFFFLGTTPKDVTRQYSHVFGPSVLPPLFAIAYHQCRWNYNDQQDVLGVDANFDKYDIPVDVIWLDIEHTNGKRYFSWDNNKFPDSAAMLNALSHKGRNMVTIVDPHIKTDSGWELYEEGRDHPSCAIFVKNKDGKNFEGHCWPGTSSWVDYTAPCARTWWSQQFALDKYIGSTSSLFTWNDMNEPSVFNGPEVTMHKDGLHAEGWEHRDVHNMYGFYMHSASRDGHVLRSGGKDRPFVLSRAFFVGSHRIGPIWTGDNYASWEHLRMSIPMLLSLNIAGYPFVGADTGGFFGNPPTDLLVRWYQTAIFQPFFRAHAHIDTKRREPWLFGEENTKLIREAVVLRYQLLPYIYTQFYQASVDNTPIMRPLWFDHVADTSLYSNEHEFMLGDSLLSSPVLHSSENTHTVTLPGPGIWYSYDSHTKQAPGIVQIPVSMSSMPLFIKGGSIIPLKKRVRRSSPLTANDPYTLIIALNAKGEADGHVYMDDGKTSEYKNNVFSYQKLTFKDRVLTCRSAVIDAHFVSSAVEKIVILGVSSSLSPTLEGTSLSASYDTTSQTLTLKKPSVVLSEDWTINFS